MPELPDLEVFKTNIYNRISSKILVDLEVYNPRKMITPKKTLLDALAGRELLGIERIGKELYFDFGDKKTIAAHLMLSGRISIVKTAKEVEAIGYKIFSMSFAEETVVFSDAGGLCSVKLSPPVSKTPDAFGDAFSLEYFLGIAKKKQMSNIKAFLICQKVVKGIGNAYADEILWAARISPKSFVGKIPEPQMAVLYEAIGSVLRDAITSIKQISPDIISGEERSFLKVHNRKLKKTETGYPVIVEKIASKTTYYTEEQVFY